METAAKVLYSGFPRTVASTRPSGGIGQFFVQSESEFDLWFDAVKSDRNLYSSICRFRSDMRPILDEIPFDLDSPMKETAFDEETTDIEKIEMMREDDDLAYEVLGDVWNDAQKLMKKCLKEDLPAIAVFSGLGVHIHILYQEEIEPTEQKVSTTQWLIDECDLFTHDVSIITDTRRILRVPNSQRVSNGEPAGVWCIPMTELEVINNDVPDVFERCSHKKNIKMKDKYEHENRPVMEIKEGYENVEADTAGSVPLDDTISASDIGDLEEELAREGLAMPCVMERFFSSNPHHMIRFTGTILLYQGGYTPGEVQQLISKIGWIDYDPKITKKMTEQIYKKGYSELPCKRLQNLGLCVYGPDFEEYEDNPKSCETHKWSSGVALY